MFPEGYRPLVIDKEEIKHQENLSSVKILEYLVTMVGGSGHTKLIELKRGIIFRGFSTLTSNFTLGTTKLIFPLLFTLHIH
jgi:hypothetical protein